MTETSEIIYIYNMESILLYCNVACLSATIQLNQKTKQKLIYKNLISFWSIFLISDVKILT